MAVVEQSTPVVDRLYAQDPSIAAWWGTQLECASTLMRLRREATLTGGTTNLAQATFDGLFAEVEEVPPTDEVRARAIRLLAHHPLRAADAFQLAAAVEWSGDHPIGCDFVCLDNRLRDAALREGFTVLP